MAQGSQGCVEAALRQVIAHQELLPAESGRLGLEQGLEEGAAFFGLPLEQSDTRQHRALGPVGDHLDQVGQELALGSESDDLGRENRGRC